MSQERKSPAGGNGRASTTNDSGRCATQHDTTETAQLQRQTVTIPLVVPEALEGIDHWVCWRYAPKPDGGKPDKLPVNPHTGGNAMSNTPSTWADLNTALDHYHAHPDKVSGIGWVPRGTDITAVDLDDCVIDGAPAPWAAHIMRQLDTYAEYSPSGTGLRLFLVGKAPGRRRRHGKIELYDGNSTQYLTFTGNHVPGTPLTVEKRQEQLTWLYDKTFPPKPQRQERPQQTPALVHGTPLAVILQKAFTAKDGAQFQRLWVGDASGHSSQSEADFALVGKLAFWLGPDADAIDSAFRGSGLMRDKWDQRHAGDGRTYGQLTIDNVLAGKTAYWTPPPPKSPGGPKPTARGKVAAQLGAYWPTAEDAETCPLCSAWHPVHRDHGTHIDLRFGHYWCHQRDCPVWQRKRAHDHLACIEDWEAVYLVDLGEDEYDHWRDAVSLKTDHYLAVPVPNDKVEALKADKEQAIKDKDTARIEELEDAIKVEDQCSRVLCFSAVPMLNAIPLDDLQLAIDVMVPAIMAIPARTSDGSHGKRLRKPKKKRAARVAEDAQESPQAAQEPQEQPQWQRGWFGIDTLDNGQLDRILGILARHGIEVKRHRGWYNASIDKDVLPQVARDVRQAMADMGKRLRIDREIDALPKNGHSASISGDLVTIEDHGGGISPAAMTCARQIAVKQHTRLAVV